MILILYCVVSVITAIILLLGQAIAFTKNIKSWNDTPLMKIYEKIIFLVVSSAIPIWGQILVYRSIWSPNKIFIV